jgi:hypothetical protein
MTNAITCWNKALPEWVETLARHADQSSQAAAGRAIGYSDGVVNAVIRNRYNGDLQAVEKAVRGAFMASVVTCPVLGEIGAHICLEHQKRAVTFSAGSSLRVAMAKACRGGCPNSRMGRR